MQCTKPEYHDEHFFPDEHDNDAWCQGNYEVLASFGVWRIIRDPKNPQRGYIDTDPASGLPPYAIDSERVHEGENGSDYTWLEHMSEKIWAMPHLHDFAAALAAAQQRWPCRKAKITAR